MGVVFDDAVARQMITSLILDNNENLISPKNLRDVQNKLLDVQKKTLQDYEVEMDKQPFVTTKIAENPTEVQFKDAIATFGSNPKTVIVNRQINITSNYTIPENINIQVENGGSFNISNNITLEIKGGFSCGYYRAFFGSGFPKLVSNAVLPEWFGAVGGGVIDNIAAFTRCVNYLNKVGGGNIILSQQYKGNLIINYRRISVSGSGVIKNSAISLIGATGGTYFDCSIRDISIIYDNITPSEDSETNNGVELKNVAGVDIRNMYFEKTNANVYVIPTGVFQSTKRILVSNCRSQWMNYGIKVAKTTDEMLTPPGSSRYSVGDFQVSGCTFQWAYYDHIYSSGADGFKFNQSFCFSSPTLGENKATKRCNINLEYCTRVKLDGLHLFEAGEDGIRLTNCSFVEGTQIGIDWPGQRVASSGIHIIQTANPTDIERNFIFHGIHIDTPTLHGTFIEGQFPSQNYIFTAITVHKLGRSDRYYGAEDPFFNPGLGTYPHQTIFADSSVSGVIYNDCLYDSEWITRGAKFDGERSFWKETNSRRGVERNGRAKNSVVDYGRQSSQPTLIENLLLNSNGLSTPARFSVVNCSITQVDNVDTPFATASGTMFKLTDNLASAGNNQKYIALNGSIPKAASPMPFTFSLHGIAGEREFICVYVSDNSLNNNGVKVDYDIKNGTTGSIQILGNGYSLINSNIEVSNNGVFRIDISIISPADRSSVRPAVYLKDKIENPGNQAYVGDGVSGLYLSDFQISQTSVPLPYVLTTGTAQARRIIKYDGVGSIIGTANQVIVSNNNGAVTLSLPQSIGVSSAPKFGGLSINSSAASNRDINFTTADVQRWSIRVSDAQETFQLIRRDDAGANLGNALAISRQTGRVSVGASLKIGTVPIYADNAAAVSAGLEAGDVYRTATGVLMIRY